MDDPSVIDAVKAELARLGQADTVHVHEKNGVVTLTGQVADRELRRIVAQEILRLPQVLDVANELDIPLPAGDFRHQLLELLDSEGVDVAGLTIAEADGAVRLGGEAAGWFDRDAAERLAWTLPGVRSVANEIRIPPDAADPELAERRP